MWEILQKGKVTTYIERLHGYKPHITKSFFKNWFEDRVTLHGVTVKLTEDFIAKVIGLPNEGLKFNKETSISNAAFKKFPKREDKEKRLKKNGDFYELKQIKVIWRDVLSCNRDFLNHFRHKDRISFPFFLKYSLLLSLYAHRKK